MQKTIRTDHVQIQAGAFRAFVLPENVTKTEEKLSKVKPPVYSIPKPSARDKARVFPAYKPGMSTAEYVRQFEKANAMCYPQHLGMVSPYENLNAAPAAQYDATVPLCVEDANPDYVPGQDDASVKAKRTRKTAKPAPDKFAVMWLLMDHGLTIYQANPLADKLIALFSGE